MSAFPDLRQNEHTGSDGGFWPLFTDIMSVVMLIFMLAMLSLLVRNQDLLSQLKATIAAERAASEQVESSHLTNRALQTKLDELESARFVLQMQLQQLQEHAHETEQRLASIKQENEVLSLANRQGMEQFANLQQAYKGAQAQIKQQQERLTGLRTEQQSLREQYQQQLLQQRDLQAQMAQRDQKLLELHQVLQQKSTAYTSLEGKYQALLRPARSSKGRYIVEVRYAKKAGVANLSIRPIDGLLEKVNEQQLYQRLDALKKQHAKDMYLKIIFPEDSGLSYSEAWKFTQTLLNRYDYYYQH